MRLRPYRVTDADRIGEWIDSELVNAYWSANTLPYPFDAQAFEQKRLEGERQWSNACFVVTEDDGNQVGYLHMSINDAENFAFFGFVVVDGRCRGKGYGYEMIRLAKKYAFEIANLSKARIAVFDRNEAALKCYQRNGFQIVEHQENAFVFDGVNMGRYILEAYKEK